ncbi:caspase family protein [Leptolyngbya sp. FACHB-711]|uniref:caspase family protein n=1 Tax=unclassified Leptolyngbya TaxID=2650499 RepID=UPI0018F0559D|nr:caspase family protein [Leptolyngbya sp. FACHB-711]
MRYRELPLHSGIQPACPILDSDRYKSMRVNRREFLQRFGSILAALGLSEAGWFALTDRSQQVLAQPTRRKLALLIGINQYPEAVGDFVPPKGTALNGCLTDVELQRELLLHRFGFQPADILTLTDHQATRSAIESAFQAHLIDQARSGDVVLFHFSGLGSQVLLDQAPTEQQSLVPIDGVLPTADNPIVNDLMLETLELLLRSLPTQQIITVLDTGFTHLGRVTQGSLRIRSRPSAPSGQLLEAEQTLQSQLLERLQLSRATLHWASPPGVLLTGSGGDQVSTEAQWSGFHAGLLTYALTQQLWCSTSTTMLNVGLGQAMRTTTPSGAIGKAKQAAEHKQQFNSSNQKRLNLTAVLDSNFAFSADGVVRSIDEEGKVQLWLGGLPAIVLENVGASLFAVMPADSENQSPRLLQLRSREGLMAKAKHQGGNEAESMRSSSPLGGIEVGQVVQEVMRFLPRNLNLTVGLDASLERVERVDATSAFATIPQVSSVIAGEQSADLLFGKTQLKTATLTAALPPTSPNSPGSATPALTLEPPSSKRGYALFFLDRSAIYTSLNQDDEAVKTAIHRMTPQLQALFANKLLRLLENQGSSRLGVRATLLTTAPQEQIISQQETARAPWAPPQPYADLQTTGLPEVAIGSRIQYQILNYSDRPLYWIGLGLDAEGIPVVYPPGFANDSSPASQTPSSIAPGATHTLLQTDADSLIQPSSGITETHLILSRSPFAQTVELLNNKLRVSSPQRMSNFTQFLALVQAILQDLHQTDAPADVYAFDVNQWAAFSFIYEVISA